jgi:hypothetical protein
MIWRRKPVTRATGAVPPPPFSLDDDQATRVRKRIWNRVRNLSVHELLDYVDEAGAGMNRGLADYRKNGDVSALHEIDEALLVLKVITEELIIRWEAEQGR